LTKRAQWDLAFRRVAREELDSFDNKFRRRFTEKLLSPPAHRVPGRYPPYCYLLHIETSPSPYALASPPALVARMVLVGANGAMALITQNMLDRLYA
jgi:hypothetical protein